MSLTNEEGDYNCAYEVEPEELILRIEPARQLIEKVEELVKNERLSFL